MVVLDETVLLRSMYVRSYATDPCAQKPGENLLQWVARSGTCAGGRSQGTAPTSTPSTPRPPGAGPPNPVGGRGTNPASGCHNCANGDILCELGKVSCEFTGGFGRGADTVGSGFENVFNSPFLIPGLIAGGVILLIVILKR